LLAEYERAPEVTRERLYLDTMEAVLARTPKVMIDIENGNNLMFLPLDKLLSGSNSGSGSSSDLLPGAGSDTTSVMDEFKRNVSRSRTRETR
jgi:membrane protease subunit HflK